MAILIELLIALLIVTVFVWVLTKILGPKKPKK